MAEDMGFKGIGLFFSVCVSKIGISDSSRDESGKRRQLAAPKRTQENRTSEENKTQNCGKSER